MRFNDDIDYIRFYAKELQKDASKFSQQKKFIEAQLQMSKSIFMYCKGKDFKAKARVYLKGRGLL